MTLPGVQSAAAARYALSGLGSRLAPIWRMNTGGVAVLIGSETPKAGVELAPDTAAPEAQAGMERRVPSTLRTDAVGSGPPDRLVGSVGRYTRMVTIPTI